VRRYTAKPVSNREFFTEVPFDLELDGPYFSLLDFFKKVGGLERIINISGLRMASVKKAVEAGVKKTYAYSPNESVVVGCVATTYFSKEVAAAAPAAAPASPKKKKS
jgi:Tfp pilus assembly protein PilO